MRYTRRSIQKITALLLALCLAQCFAAPAAFGESVQEGAMDGTVRVYLSSLGQRSRVDLTVCGSYSLDGTEYIQLRKFYLIRDNDEIKIGAYLCAPQNDDFSAVLRGISLDKESAPNT